MRMIGLRNYRIIQILIAGLDKAYVAGRDGASLGVTITAEELIAKIEKELEIIDVQSIAEGGSK